MTYAVLLERVRAWPVGCAGSGSARATGSSSTCRWSPRPSSRCSPAPASAPSTPSSSAGSRRRSSPPASTTPRRRSCCRRRAASSRAASCAYKPFLDEAIRRSAAPARALRRPPARAAAPPSSASATSTGPTSSPATPPPRAASASRSRRPTRSTSSTRPARRGSPRASYRDNGGYAVALRLVDGATSTTSRPGETMFTASDVGWVVGHSYIVYAPLLTGRDDRPLRGQAGRHARRRRVLAGHRRVRRRLPCSPRRRRTAPSRRRTRRRQGGRPRPVGLPDPLPRRRAARPRHLRVGLRPRSACRSSTTGGRPRPGGRSPPTCAGLEPLPIKPGRRRCAVPGLRRAGARRARRSRSTRASRGPSASGCRCRPARCRRCGATTTATSRRYLSAYDGYYLTGDGGYLDEDGYLFVMGRTDDVLNVAGHRLSTGSIEAALAGHPDVAECAVIGVADELKGQVPRGLVVLKAGRRRRCRRRADPAPSSSQRVRDEVGAVAALRQVDIVGRRCPRPARARSCARRCARWPTARARRCPATIEDVSVLDALAPVLRGS